MEVNNFTRFKVREKYLRKLADSILQGEGKTAELSVSLVSPVEIKKLNKKYRKKNRQTDVLSFTYKGSGEIILCPKVILEDARKYREDFENELHRVFVHGILHILGYDHEKSKKGALGMEDRQSYYLSVAKLKNRNLK